MTIPSENSVDNLLGFATFGLVVATFALAIVTVFQKEMRRWFIRPRLEKLSAGSTERYIVRAPSAWIDNIEKHQSQQPAPTPPPAPSRPAGERAPWYWVRMEIENGTCCSEIGRDIEIFITEIQSDSGVNLNRLPIVGLNLLWSWGKDTIFSHILPGSSKFFNIGHIVHPDGWKDYPDYPVTDDAKKRAFMTLASYPSVPGYEAILEAGTYKLRLLIGGKNVKPKAHWIKFKFGEKWILDESLMRKSISIIVEEK